MISDLNGRVLMPGLIAAHAHIYLTEVDLARLEGIPVSLISARATVARREMLNCKFTTLRDEGGADRGIRELVERDSGAWTAPVRFRPRPVLAA